MNATRLDKPRSVRTKRPLKSYPERQAAARADRGRRARALRRKGDPVLAERWRAADQGSDAGRGLAPYATHACNGTWHGPFIGGLKSLSSEASNWC